MIVLPAALAAFALMTPAPYQYADASQAKPVSLCELADHPKRFAGKWVMFRAIVRTDGEHFAMYYDPSCRGGEGAFINLGRAAPETDPFFFEISPHAPGPLAGSTAEATFTGQVVLGEPNPMVGPWRNYEVFTIKVEDVKISPRPPGP